MSAPPKPSKPGLVRVFKALYTYEATQPDEISFAEGDVLYIPATEIAGIKVLASFLPVQCALSILALEIDC